MGNLKFRLSDMMPNSWFYKLRDMGRTRNQSSHNSTRKTSTSTPQKSKPNHHPRKSYYFTRDLIPNHTFHNSPTNPNTNSPADPPRKSSKQRARARGRTRSRTTSSSSPKLVTSSVSAGCICRFDSAWKISDSPPENSSPELCQTLPPAEFRSDRILAGTHDHHHSFDKMVSWSSSCKCRANSDANDIVLDIDNKYSFANKFDEVDGFYAIPDLELPPIITKPAKFNDMVRDIKKKETKEAIKPRRREEKINLREHKNSNVGRLSVTSPGVRLRINSPKIRGRRIQDEKRRQSPTDEQRRSRLSDSFAMVKSSFDPQKDFRKSMVEMIVENNIRESKDLEELLACYLSLNSAEYHDLIIKVFKQIWLDLS